MTLPTVVAETWLSCFHVPGCPVCDEADEWEDLVLMKRIPTADSVQELRVGACRPLLRLPQLQDMLGL